MKQAYNIFFLVVFSFILKGQDSVKGLESTYVLELQKDPVRIGKHFVFFEDEKAKMSFHQVQKQKGFVFKDLDIPNFNITKSAIWGKIKFVCKENLNWYLQIDPASFNKVVFYQKQGGEEWREEELGNAFPKWQRPLQINHYMFRIKVSKQDTTEVYFMVKDYYPMQFDIKVGTLESFVEQIHNSDIYNGICYGIMIMMLIYNFYLFATQKTIVYLYYVLYVFFSMVFSAYLGGYALHFPSLLLKLIQFAPILPPACFGIFGLLFTLQLFKEVFSLRYKRLVYIFISVAAADILLSITSLVHLAENIIQPLGLLLGILCISGAIIALRKKHSSAIFYLMGFGAYMGSLFYLIFSAQGAFTATNFTWHALATGSAIESIMLSFAIGDKLKVSLREKQKAQEEAILQAKENERLVKEQNVLLEYKVKERTVELEEKNKEILDSIHYARRIQHTLLAHAEFLKSNLPEHFVLFKPKDIVSGDFYWATSIGSKQKAGASDTAGILPTADCQRFYLAVCDSTGHGVPGAFMSLLNISFLNEAITEKGITDPGKVFDHVRKRLIENISQDGGKDGMDGILSCFEKGTNGNTTLLNYSAANNAPVLIRNNEVLALDKDKMPVGQGEKKDPFSSYSVELQTGDCIYLFTDGYGDQFGGPKGKKFKFRKLEEKLLEVNRLPLADQKEILEKTFNDWKGNLEQVDDVLVIGIKI
ncbi:MAG: 7TM diverse intracellular signaling domain-containing protein [Bacteroidia bacterium]